MPVIRHYPFNVSPIMISKEDDGYWYPHQASGYNKYILPSEIENNIIPDLIFYCNSYSDEEIKELNEEIEEHYFDDWNFSSNNKTNKVQNKSGYIYLLKCVDKYKIGYSNNVERRIKQLDTRPFELSLVFKCYSDNAYAIEQELHKRYEAYKVTGEWYQDIKENDVKNTIIEIGGYLKCDIQF